MHSGEAHQKHLHEPQEPCSEERKNLVQVIPAYTVWYVLEGEIPAQWRRWCQRDLGNSSRFDDDEAEELRTRVQQVVQQQHRALVGQVLAKCFVQPGKVDAI